MKLDLDPDTVEMLACRLANGTLKTEALPALGLNERQIEALTYYIWGLSPAGNATAMAELLTRLETRR